MYDTNSYANIFTICKYLGSNVSKNILQYRAIFGCDIISFFYRVGEIELFKEVIKNQAV